MTSRRSDEITAFFDLDRTLISINSGFDYAWYERRRGRISLWQFLRATAWIGLYHLSLVDMRRAFAEAVRHYRGVQADELRRITSEFFDEHVAHTVQPGAKKALHNHRSRGHRLVLLTASSPYMSELAADALDLDDWICNRFPTDDEGRLVGCFERPMCYGQGKVHRARCWARRHNLDIEDAYFYTDSYSDLPMLKQVEHPRVVNPDPRLRREATRRDWTIEDWSSTAD